MSADVETFSGTIIRSLSPSSGGYQQFFQWFDPDRIERTSTPISGDIVLDQYAFDFAPQLGAAVIYNRSLAPIKESDAARYFAGNESVEFDTSHRAKISASEINWPTDEEYLNGFAEMHSPTYLQDRYGSQDPDWDRGAATAFQWLTARAIVHNASATREVLCWAPAERWELDWEVILRVKERVREEGLLVSGDLIELFQSHSLRPYPGMTVFQIGERSALPVKDYVQSLGFTFAE